MIPQEYQSLELKREDARHWWFLCPFHSDHTPSLSVNKAGEYFGHFKCWACGEHGSPKRFARLTGSLFSVETNRKYKVQPKPYRQKADLTLLAKKYSSAINVERLEQFQNIIGIAIPQLVSLGIGWDGRAFTFPMYGSDNMVIGIRRRFTDGGKSTLSGTYLGLFLADYRYNPQLPLFITEGESDCLAALSLGLQAIGRPSSNSCKELVLEWIVKNGIQEAVVIADNDKVGLDGAKNLSESLAFAGIKTKVMSPPESFKDLRQWYLSGAKTEDVLNLVAKSKQILPVRITLRNNGMRIDIGGHYEK